MLFKAKYFLLLMCLALYTGFAIYQIRNAHPAKVIYAAVYSEWNYSYFRLLPFPFRRFIAKNEFSRRSLSDMEGEFMTGINLTSVLGVKEYNKINEDSVQKRLEGLADELYTKGVGLNRKDIYGCTALKIAIINEDPQSVTYLVKKGALLEDSEALQNIYPKDKPSFCQRNINYLLEEFLPEYALGE